MKILPIPCLSDNYSYLLIDEVSGKAAAVDVADCEKVLDVVKSIDVSLTHILTTHHHNDHDGGNRGVALSIPEIIVCGGDRRIKSLTKLMKNNETIFVGNLCIKTLFAPCHTSGHVLYYLESSGVDESPIIFTGDTLFVGGCGRFFEGTPEQMHYALNILIASLPMNTAIYCGHEYTVSNLEFAVKVEPNNQHAIDKLAWARERRLARLPTIPSLLGEEVSYNPFMRLSSPDIHKSLNLSFPQPPEKVMHALRMAKNNQS